MQKSSRISIIEGEITAPTSKSALQRHIAAALLASGTTTLHQVTLCDDSVAALRLSEDLGAKIAYHNNLLRITGGDQPRKTVLNCGESGLALRMFAAIAARYPYEIQLTGEKTLRQRPVAMLVEPLQQLGATCQTTDGHPPIVVCGPLRGGYAAVDGSISSQFLTGLLLVLPTLSVDTELRVIQLRSRPYIDLTVAVLRQYGITVTHQDYERFVIAGRQRYEPVDTFVEGDWSGAAFLLVAAALQGRVTLIGLDPVSPQADRRILAVLRECGARVEVTSNEIKVAQASLNAFHFDATDCPDLFPPLVALASGCAGTSSIKGVQRLVHKESNRAAVLGAEFARLGIDITVENDTMRVTGGPIRGGIVSAQRDHRIAMALAVAGLRAAQPVIIEEVECVAKSYPDFWDDLRAIGGRIDE